MDHSMIAAVILIPAVLVLVASAFVRDVLAAPLRAKLNTSLSLLTHFGLPGDGVPLCPAPVFNARMR
jgi:hypothetical protein